MDMLVGSLEYRCCREVIHTSGKMVLDGSIDHINCITEHEDYSAVTNTTVLRQAGPLLKHKDGSYYRKKKNMSENEYVPYLCVLFHVIIGFMKNGYLFDNMISYYNQQRQN